MKLIYGLLFQLHRKNASAEGSFGGPATTIRASEYPNLGQQICGGPGKSAKYNSNLTESVLRAIAYILIFETGLELHMVYAIPARQSMVNTHALRGSNHLCRPRRKRGNCTKGSISNSQT